MIHSIFCVKIRLPLRSTLFPYTTLFRSLLIGRRMIVRQHLPEFLDAVALALLLGELAHLDLGIVPLDRFFEENIAGVFCREGNRRKQEGDGNQRFGLHRTLRLSAWCTAKQ